MLGLGGGGSGSGRYSSFLRYRPAFMERDMVAPSWEVLDGGGGRGDYCSRVDIMAQSEEAELGGRGAIRRRRRSSLSPFPMNNDARYYIHDDGNLVVSRIRHELLGSDVTFSTTLLLIVVVVLLILWGVVGSTP